MQDLNSRSFDRTGRGHPNSLTVRPLCPKAQQMPAWRSCWFRHLTWCRRRRPRRRPREHGRVPGARCRRICPTPPTHPPPPKTRRRKKKKMPLPLQRGEERKERPPQLGSRRVREGEDPSAGLRPRRRRRRGGTGHPGSSPWKIVSVRLPE